MDWYVTYSEDIGNKPKSSNYYKETADNFTNVNYDDTDSDDFFFSKKKRRYLIPRQRWNFFLRKSPTLK